ncbi:MAG TPA: hypothetical protein VHA77_00935 [Xanthobacteraceae bacterium]|nr:hypothetical protein [Xanthobacteraceae bacterium]
MSSEDTANSDVLELARLAGLEKAVRQFQADIIAAAQSAERARSTLPPVAITAETWPPSRLRRQW